MGRRPEPRENVIYALSCTCHPERGRRYVGLTVAGAQRRLWAHRKEARSGRRRPVYHWMRKHGDENIVTEVLERCDTLESLASAEVKWIRALRADGEADLNMTDGGEGTSGYSPSAESRAKTAARMIGNDYHKLVPPEVRAAVGATNAMRMADPEYRREHGRKVRAKWAANPEMSLNRARKFSTLTDDDVRAIRQLRVETGASYFEIARVAGVSHKTVGQIVRRTRWASLPD